MMKRSWSCPNFFKPRKFTLVEPEKTEQPTLVTIPIPDIEDQGIVWLKQAQYCAKDYFLATCDNLTICYQDDSITPKPTIVSRELPPENAEAIYWAHSKTKFYCTPNFTWDLWAYAIYWEEENKKSENAYTPG